MLVNILIGVPTMLVCLLLQSLLLVTAIRYYRRHRDLVESPSFWSTLVVTATVMTILLLGNLAQTAIWAEVFLLLGEFQRFELAFYHSAVNFSTLGYGDMVMDQQHRLLGPLEAINGVLMIGVSTSALMATLQDSMRKTLHARTGESPRSQDP